MTVIRYPGGGTLMGGSPGRVPPVINPSTAPRTIGPNSQSYLATPPQPIPSALNTFSPSDYPSVTTIPLTVSPGAYPNAILVRPQQYRTLFVVRNSAASPAGSFLWIAFGMAATEETALFEIPVGGLIYVDTKVPQDDVYVNSSVAGVGAVIGYANSNVTFAQLPPGA